MSGLQNDGANQRRLNPALRIGAMVEVTPDDVDAIVSDVTGKQIGFVVGFFDAVYVKVELDGGSSHIFYVGQLEVQEDQKHGN